MRPEGRLLDRPEQPARAIGAAAIPLLDARLSPSASSLSSATHGSLSSRMFQTSAIRPPGRSTRAISRERRAVVEPVERLGNRDDVGARVRERDRLRPTFHGGHLRNSVAEMREHLGERLDGRHPMPESNEGARQLARSRTEVDDVERLGAHEPAHRVIGIPRTGTLVGIRDSAERGALTWRSSGFMQPILGFVSLQAAPLSKRLDGAPRGRRSGPDTTVRAAPARRLPAPARPRAPARSA